MRELATYELDGRIATITMDDGKVNAFSIAMLRAIHGALDQAERDRAVVVLSGRAGYFSAGFDLNVFVGGGDAVLEMLTLGAKLAERVLSFTTPVVVACSGHAIAAGAFLPLSADARIGVSGPFQIGLSEVKIGLTVPWFAIEIARQRLHPAYFDRTVVNATLYQPADAVAAGFLDAVAQRMSCGAGASTPRPRSRSSTRRRTRPRSCGRARAHWRLCAARSQAS